MSTGTQKGSVRFANQARNNAVREMIKRHSSEYDEILIEERKKFGLLPSNKFASQIKKAENLRDRMKDMGLDTTSIDEQIQKMVGSA